MKRKIKRQQRVGDRYSPFQYIKAYILTLSPVVLLGIILYGCGVQSYPYLEPPEVSQIAEPIYRIDKEFKFGNNPDNNPEYFRGYEIYYKFYSSADNDSTLESDKELIESNPTREELVNRRGYRRLYSYDESSVENIGEILPPLIPVSSDNKKEDFFITLNFSDSVLLSPPASFPLASYLSEEFPICRYTVVDGAETAIGFSQEDFSQNVSYSDFSYTTLIDTNLLSATFSMACYVVTYGKYDVFREIYSAPAYLGRIELQASEY